MATTLFVYSGKRELLPGRQGGGERAQGLRYLKIKMCITKAKITLAETSRKTFLQGMCGQVETTHLSP